MQMHTLTNDSPEPVNQSPNDAQLDVSPAPSAISQQSDTIDRTAKLNSEGDDSYEDSVTMLMQELHDLSAGTPVFDGNRRKTATVNPVRVYPSNFFEGAEKRIAVFFSPMPDADLRNISRDKWKRILDLVKCRILNVISNEHFDAYLLSESSMFVTKNRVIIKTCGSTTTLACLEPLLRTVLEYGFESFEDIVFCHKNLLLPARQLGPHQSFEKESEYLDDIFAGLAHTFGHLKRDQFHLYTLTDHALANLDSLKDRFKFELIMEQLDPKKMEPFFFPKNCNFTAKEVTRKSGIDTILPRMTIDDHLFTPCGYSMNGIYQDQYMTIHITPEPEFSYVSFETNSPQTDYMRFIEKVLSLFKPSKWMLNCTMPDMRMFCSSGNESGYGSSTGSNEASFKEWALLNGIELYGELVGHRFDDFRCSDLQIAHYKHCDLVFARYVAEGIS